MSTEKSRLKTWLCCLNARWWVVGYSVHVMGVTTHKHSLSLCKNRISSVGIIIKPDKHYVISTSIIAVIPIFIVHLLRFQ